MVTELRTALNGGASGDFKIVVVGPRSVGKSALIVRFLTKRFINEYLENTEMTYERKVNVDGQMTHMAIHDTSEKGMEWDSMVNYCQSANAIMLMYSITDAQSFEQLKEVAEKLRAKASCEDKNESYVPSIVLVANKGDLDYLRKVSQEEGYKLAESLNCKLYETSARDGWTKQIISHDSGNESESETTSSGSRRYGTWTIRKSTSVKSPLFIKGAPEGPMKRWSSYCTLRPIRFQHHRGTSKRVSPRVNAVKSYNESPSSSSPSSDCESDDSLKTTMKTRRRFMDKLSPLLSRRSLLLHQEKKLEAAAAAKHAISNLVECSSNVGGSLHSVKHCKTVVVEEKEVCDSQPFVELCRDARTRFTKSFIRSVNTAVARTKSPTNFLRTSLRKIYHLATEQHNNSMKPTIQALSVPHFRF